MIDIVILSSMPYSYSVQSLKNEANKRGHFVDIIDPYDLYLYISETKVDAIFRKESRVNKKKIGAVIPRVSGKNFNYGCAVLQHMTKNMGKFATASVEGLKNASDKFLTGQILSEKNIKTPKSIIANSPKDFGFLIDQVGGLPCVAKLQRGSMGIGVFLLETPAAASTSLQSISSLGVNVVIQRKVYTGVIANDIRVIVVDGEVIAAYRRYSLADDFRSNYSISGEGEKIKLTNAQKKLAIAAAKAVGLAVCGVDIMEEVEELDIEKKDNETLEEWRERKKAEETNVIGNYVIEVNGNPGLKGVETVTGVNVAAAIIDYVERNVKEEEHKQGEGSKGASYINSVSFAKRFNKDIEGLDYNGVSSVKFGDVSSQVEHYTNKVTGESHYFRVDIGCWYEAVNGLLYMTNTPALTEAKQKAGILN